LEESSFRNGFGKELKGGEVSKLTVARCERFPDCGRRLVEGKEIGAG